MGWIITEGKGRQEQSKVCMIMYEILKSTCRRMEISTDNIQRNKKRTFSMLKLALPVMGAECHGTG